MEKYSNSLTPEIVLQRFHQLKENLLSIIEDGRFLAEQIPAVKEAAQIEFDKAENSVSRQKLSLAVLGAEGAGKSTLIRGILKAELSPIEENKPGTVAPVYIKYGDKPEGEYTVEFLDNKKPKVCDKKECFEYIQQKTNKDNEKKVARASIKVNNPLLKNGLELVDMPGIGGVSDQVRIEAQKFIRSHTAAVIAVIDKRSFSSLTDLARSIMDRDQGSFQAIVSNRPSDWFEIQDGSSQPLPNEVIKEKIKQARIDAIDTIAPILKECGFKNLPTEEDVFNFSANTLYTQKGKIATEAHLDEINRFLDKISRYIQENGLGSAILHAAARCEQALAMLSSYIEIRRSLLECVLNGDKNFPEYFSKVAAAAIDEHWVKGAYTHEHVEKLANKAWEEINNTLISLHAVTTGRIDKVVAEINQWPEDIPTEKIRDKVAALQDYTSEHVTNANKSLQAILERIKGELTKDANIVLKEILTKLPVLERHGAVEIEITNTDILYISEINTEDGRRALLKSVGAVSGAGIGGAVGSAVGSKGAFLLAIPEPITMTIGALLLGSTAFVAAGAAINKFLGTEKKVALDKLRKLRKSLEQNRDKENKEYKEYIDKSVAGIGELIDVALKLRLQQLQVLVTNPTGEDLSQIKTEYSELDKRVAELHKLTQQILEIRIMVTPQIRN
ncbi:dynamin family protein [Nitrosomonas sp. Nm166]|uniref:dynamin family protein n=1 Tax=Nitrosomonas sp. Nm166 TaxID=1881054 RepID=UPI0008E8BF09|nr:dynamin family protein [Nitrosomonas sp. Nm166]SFF23149.1 Dynamin family protein [Nitrosomonas sp. Nm166]